MSTITYLPGKEPHACEHRLRFPTGIKWGFIPPNNTKPVYLICNCDESEPGTFKDRYIVHQDPHQLIEGMLISAFAVGAHTAYIYMREEFPEAALIMEKAIEEARVEKKLGLSNLSRVNAPTHVSNLHTSLRLWVSIWLPLL